MTSREVKLESIKRSDDHEAAQIALFKDLAGGLLVLLLTLVLFAPAVSDIYIDPRDPGFSSRDFPIGVLTLLVLLSCVLLLRPLYRLMHRGNQWRWNYSRQTFSLFRHVIPMIGIGFGYTWLVSMFQYFVPTFLVTAGAMAVYGNRGMWRLLVVPLLVSVFFYLLFFGVLGLYEEPGSVFVYHNQAVFGPVRDALRSLSTW